MNSLFSTYLNTFAPWNSTTLKFNTIKTTSKENVPQALIDLAIAGGGGDNITVALVTA